MATHSDSKKKRIGRPRTGIGTLIGLRLSESELAALDAWREKQSEKLNRPQAIRHLLKSALNKE